jgi:hypothetical protein
VLKLPSIAAAALVTVVVAVPGLSACASAPPPPSASSSSTSIPWSFDSSIPPTTDTPTPAVSPEDLDPSTYQAISPREFALLVKDPDASTGRKIILYGIVTQFDTDTGQNSFRARTGADPSDYRQNTIFYAHDQSILSQVVAHDAVEIWCQVNGTETYKTTINGQQTVPRFWVNIIKDNGSTDPDQNRPGGH